MSPEFKVTINLHRDTFEYLVDAPTEQDAAIAGWDLFENDLADGEAIVMPVKEVNTNGETGR